MNIPPLYTSEEFRWQEEMRRCVPQSTAELFNSSFYHRFAAQGLGGANSAMSRAMRTAPCLVEVLVDVVDLSRVWRWH